MAFDYTIKENNSDMKIYPSLSSWEQNISFPFKLGTILLAQLEEGETKFLHFMDPIKLLGKCIKISYTKVANKLA